MPYSMSNQGHTMWDWKAKAVCHMASACTSEVPGSDDGSMRSYSGGALAALS